MNVGFIILIIIASLVVLLLLIGFIATISFNGRLAIRVYQNSTAKNVNKDNLSTADKSYFDKCFVKEDINIKLSIYIDKDETSNIYLINLHGYAGLKYDHTKVLKLIKESIPMNLITYDLRGHSESKYYFSTMGIKEKNDLIKIIKYIKVKNEKAKFILLGKSTGSTTMLRSLSSVDDVIGAISDSGFDNVNKEFSYILSHYIPKWLNATFLFSVFIFQFIFLQINIKKDDIYSSIKESKVPLCLIQGNKDSIVDSSTINLIEEKYNMDTYKEKHVFDGADHLCSYISDSKTYMEVIINFIKKFI